MSIDADAIQKILELERERMRVVEITGVPNKVFLRQDDGPLVEIPIPPPAMKRTFFSVADFRRFCEPAPDGSVREVCYDPTRFRLVGIIFREDGLRDVATCDIDLAPVASEILRAPQPGMRFADAAELRKWVDRSLRLGQPGEKFAEFRTRLAKFVTRSGRINTTTARSGREELDISIVNEATGADGGPLPESIVYFGPTVNPELTFEPPQEEDPILWPQGFIRIEVEHDLEKGSFVLRPNTTDTSAIEQEIAYTLRGYFAECCNFSLSVPG